MTTLLAIIRPIKPLTDTTTPRHSLLQSHHLPTPMTKRQLVSETFPSLPGGILGNHVNHSVPLNISIPQTQVRTSGTNSNIQETGSPKVRPGAVTPSTNSSATISTNPETPALQTSPQPGVCLPPTWSACNDSLPLTISSALWFPWYRSPPNPARNASSCHPQVNSRNSEPAEIPSQLIAP